MTDITERLAEIEARLNRLGVVETDDATPDAIEVSALRAIPDDAVDLLAVVKGVLALADRWDNDIHRGILVEELDDLRAVIEEGLGR